MTKQCIIPILTLFLFSAFSLKGQELHFGVQVGIAPGYDPGTNFIIVNRSDAQSEFTFNANKVHNAVYAGGFAKLDLSDPFFLRVEAMYNQSTTDYLLNFLGSDLPRSSQSAVYSETTRQLDLPVSIGVDLGVVNVVSGFTTQLMLDQDSELEQIAGYEKDLAFARFGFHSGVALDFTPLRIEFRYMMNFHNYGDHIRVNDQNLGLDNTPGRILGTLSYQF